MADRLNGGPFVIGVGNTAWFNYWWGNPGDDKGGRYGFGWPTDNGGEIVSFDQRVVKRRQQDGGGVLYGVTIRNDGPLSVPVDLYAQGL